MFHHYHFLLHLLHHLYLILHFDLFHYLNFLHHLNHHYYNYYHHFYIHLNHHLQNKLISALNNRRPFANFKVLVENSEYREQWFEFRQKAYELHVWDLIKVDLEESD